MPPSTSAALAEFAGPVTSFKGTTTHGRSVPGRLTTGSGLAMQHPGNWDVVMQDLTPLRAARKIGASGRADRDAAHRADAAPGARAGGDAHDGAALPAAGPGGRDPDPPGADRPPGGGAGGSEPRPVRARTVTRGGRRSTGARTGRSGRGRPPARSGTTLTAARRRQGAAAGRGSRYTGACEPSAEVSKPSPARVKARPSPWRPESGADRRSGVAPCAKAAGRSPLGMRQTRMLP